jgi:hypothetical protein
MHLHCIGTWVHICFFMSWGNAWESSHWSSFGHPPIQSSHELINISSCHMNKCICLFMSWRNAWESLIDHPICPFIVNIFVCILTSQFLTLSQWHLSSHLNKHFYFIIEFLTKLCFWKPWSGFFHYWVFWEVVSLKDLKMIPHLGQWHKGPLLFVFSKYLCHYHRYISCKNPNCVFFLWWASLIHPSPKK